jgi:hypothetical protein
VVASVNFVADQAVLGNRGMLECERSSLFGVTLETEVSDGIRFYHSWSEGPMDFMAITAFYPALFYRVMRLFILLGPDILVTGVTDIGLFCFCSMNGMAFVTRYTHGLVSANVPRSQMFCFSVTGKAFRRFG